MNDLQLVVLSPEQADPLDAWGGDEAIEAVLKAMTSAGIRAESRTVRSIHDLEKCRDRSGLPAFPSCRRLSPAESMIAPLEAWGVPLVGSGSDGLAAENKAHTKRLLVENGVPTPAYEVINGETDLREISARLGLPLIVKPLVGAESHGVIKCDDLPSLSAAVEPGLLVEQWKRHRELTVSVLGNGETRIAAPGEIVLPPAVEYLDLATKRERIVPTLAPAPDNDGTRKAVAVALDACRVLAIHDWARVDVLLDHEESPYVIDVNALPGLRKVADHPSYFPRCLALTTGMSYQQVVLALVAAAASRHRLPVPPAASSLPGTLSP